MATEMQVKNNVGDQVIARINSLCEVGFTMPKDYQFVNAIKMSMLKLQDLKDKNGRPALQVCTPASVSTALFQMATKGLNAALGQAYLLVRGDQLCLQESYFGKVLMVKRIYPQWNPNPVVIREGDVFEYSIDPATGKKFVVKHEQKLENIDKDFVGGYLYLPTGDLYIMTKKQILTAWSKSSSKEQATHKAFSEKMVGKTLVNSGCNMIINSTPEYHFDDSTYDENAPKHEDVTELEEVDDQSPSEFKEDTPKENKKKKKSEDNGVVNEAKEAEPIHAPAPTNDADNDEFPFKEDGFDF